MLTPVYGLVRIELFRSGTLLITDRLLGASCWWPVLISDLATFRGHLRTFRGSLYSPCFFVPVSPGIHQHG